MRFWDSSALLPLIAIQARSDDVKSLLDDDDDMVVWWGTRVELASGLCRLIREGAIDETNLKAAEQLADDAGEIEPTMEIRLAAIRILRVHHLQAADSLQLAAALVWTDHNPSGAGFVCLDKRLREAAEKEGFEVLPVASTKSNL